MKTIKIFLSSAGELIEERKEISSFIRQENDRLINDGIYFQLIVWEELFHSFTGDRIQNYFNQEIAKSDIVIALFHKKVGQFTKEEFDIAYNNLKEGKKPKYLFVFFKNANVSMSDLNEDIMAVAKLKKEIENVEQIYSNYDSTQDLILRIKQQLSQLIVGQVELPDYHSHSTSEINKLSIISTITTTINDFEMLKGYYLSYCYWDMAYKTFMGKVSSKIFEIYDYSEKSKTIKFRRGSNIVNGNIEWTYEGSFIILKNKIFGILECLPICGHFYPEIITYIIRYPKYWPDKDNFFLYGIYSALTPNAEPAAAKIIFRKVDRNDIKPIERPISKKELLKEQFGQEILNWIDNNADKNQALISLKPDFIEYY